MNPSPSDDRDSGTHHNTSGKDDHYYTTDSTITPKSDLSDPLSSPSSVQQDVAIPSESVFSSSLAQQSVTSPRIHSSSSLKPSIPISSYGSSSSLHSLASSSTSSTIKKRESYRKRRNGPTNTSSGSIIPTPFAVSPSSSSPSTIGQTAPIPTTSSSTNIGSSSSSTPRSKTSAATKDKFFRSSATLSTSGRSVNLSEYDMSEPSVRERIGWLQLLTNAMQSEVIQSHYKRLTTDTADNKYNLWLGIRAFFHGRTVKKEKEVLESYRSEIHKVIEQVLNFQISPDPTGPCPYEQVMNVLSKVDWVESLYPCRKMLSMDHPDYNSLPFQYNLDAMYSWVNITNALITQIGILKAWAGADSSSLFDNHAPHPMHHDYQTRQDVLDASIMDRQYHHLKDPVLSAFIDRLLKEPGVKATFEKRILTVSLDLLFKIKETMTMNSTTFSKMCLPSYSQELRQFACFPANLMEEFLKVRLDYMERVLNKITSVTLDQNIEDLGMMLNLAIHIKREYEVLNTEAVGWEITENIQSSYDVMLLRALRLYFKLLDIKFKPSTEVLATKEVELLEHEWDLLSRTCTEIAGGDVEAAVQFCLFESKFILRLVEYIEREHTMLSVVGGGGCASSGKEPAEQQQQVVVKSLRSHQKFLENVRMRSRRLLRFMRTLTNEFENAIEFQLETDSDTTSCLSNLASTGHVLINGLNQPNIHLFAHPSIFAQDGWSIHRLLTKCFTLRDETKKPSSGNTGYILLLSTNKESIDWKGASVSIHEFGSQVADALMAEAQSGFGVEMNRARLVTSSHEAMMAASSTIQESVIRCKNKLLMEVRPHNQAVYLGLKEAKDGLMLLAETIAGHPDRYKQMYRAGMLSAIAPQGQQGKEFDVAAPAAEDSISNPATTPPGSEPSDVSTSATSVTMNSPVTEQTPRLNPTPSMTTLGQSADIRALDFVEEWYSFGTDFVFKLQKSVPPKWISLLSKKMLKMAFEWTDFVTQDCVNDKKTFRWALMALDFVLLVMDGHNILELSDKTFRTLKIRVATCMALVRTYIDQHSGWSMWSVSSMVEEAEKEMIKSSLGSRFARVYQFNETELRERQEWVNALRQVEEEKSIRKRSKRLIGRVLDDRNIVERNIAFLAARSGSISLRWQQGKFLGGGGYGSVYMAFNLDTGDLMAVKEIRFQDVSSFESLMSTVKEEMNVLKILHHPHIIEYYGVEVHRDKLYIFMEYCPQSLANVLEHDGRIEDMNLVKLYTKQMLLGLEYLHFNNVVHRDIKPANVLIGHEGDIKYVDFGASKIYKSQKTVVFNGEVQNTLVGTPRYMAPEIITADRSAEWRKGSQDVWSLGCCLFQMVTGQLPWADLDSEWSLFYQVGMNYMQWSKKRPENSDEVPIIPPLPEELPLTEAYLNHHALLKRAKQSGLFSDDAMSFLNCCLRWSPNERWTATELMNHPFLASVSSSSASNLMMTGTSTVSSSIQTLIAETQGYLENTSLGNDM